MSPFMFAIDLWPYYENDESLTHKDYNARIRLSNYTDD